jgi:environmental stress-induced protein Ves
MTGHVFISEVDAFMHVVLSKAEKHVPYRELVGTTESVALWPGCRANRDHYNRVSLYKYFAF